MRLREDEPEPETSTGISTQAAAAPKYVTTCQRAEIEAVQGGDWVGGLPRLVDSQGGGGRKGGAGGAGWGVRR